MDIPSLETPKWFCFFFFTIFDSLLIIFDLQRGTLCDTGTLRFNVSDKAKEEVKLENKIRTSEGPI